MVSRPDELRSMSMSWRVFLDTGCADIMEPIEIARQHAERRRNIPTGLVKLEERLYAIGAAGGWEGYAVPGGGDTAIISELLLAGLFKLGAATIGSSVLGLTTHRCKVRVDACAASSLWPS